jgi:hypothetical protein
MIASFQMAVFPKALNRLPFDTRAENTGVGESYGAFEAMPDSGLSR